jgi:hypothetical protein
MVRSRSRIQFRWLLPDLAFGSRATSCSEQVPARDFVVVELVVHSAHASSSSLATVSQEKYPSICSGYFSWCIFTTKLELILNKMRKLSPDACGRVTPTRPTRKTLCLFFYSPSPNFFFETEKGVFWWFD